MEDAPAVPSEFARYDSRAGRFVARDERPSLRRRGASKASAADEEEDAEPVPGDERLRAEAALRFASRRRSEANSLACGGMVVCALTYLLIVVSNDNGLLRVFDYFTSFIGLRIGSSGGSGGGDVFGYAGGGGPLSRPGGRLAGRLWVDYAHPSGRKVRDTEQQLFVTPQQLYSGAEIVNVTVMRKEVCPQCSGSGGHSLMACPVCSGRGVDVVTMMVAPGRVQRMQRMCPRCNGEGRVHLHSCHACGGEGLVSRKAQLPVLLSGGLQSGDRVRLPGEGDQHMQVGPGDLIVEIKEGGGRSPSPPGARMPVAARPRSDSAEAGAGGTLARSDDLEAELTVSLREALLGFSRTVVHPGSGAQVAVSSAGLALPAAPGSVVVVHGQGMPHRPREAVDRQLAEVRDDGRIIVTELQPRGLAARRGSAAAAELRFGDLRVRLRVVLPDRLSDEARREIERILPPGGAEVAEKRRRLAMGEAADEL